MSDIVTRLWGNTANYPGFENIKTEAAREIEALHTRVAGLEAECDRQQSLANVYRTEVMASRNERSAFFNKTMNYEEWKAAFRQVEIARAATEAASAANGEVG